jgi:alkanesulfonate monooxygenase SsuD/methylene tetrahydromethanopterin reductase-like flavin-dependent oxidoreductase (luciferase family)
MPLTSRTCQIAQASREDAHRIGVDIGGAGDRILRMVAAEADGWNCPAAALPKLDERVAFLKAACEPHDRSISDLRLTMQIVCTVGDDAALQHPVLAAFAPQLGLVGSVDAAIQRMRYLAGLGFSGFYCIVPSGPAGLSALIVS